MVYFLKGGNILFKSKYTTHQLKTSFNVLYILALNFFVKDDKHYLKLEIRIVCREFLAFQYVLIVFFETDQMIIFICTSEILKTRV